MAIIETGKNPKADYPRIEEGSAEVISSFPLFGKAVSDFLSASPAQ